MLDNPIWRFRGQTQSRRKQAFFQDNSVQGLTYASFTNKNLPHSFAEDLRSLDPPRHFTVGDRHCSLLDDGRKAKNWTHPRRQPHSCPLCSNTYAIRHSHRFLFSSFARLQPSPRIKSFEPSLHHALKAQLTLAILLLGHFMSS